MDKTPLQHIKTPTKLKKITNNSKVAFSDNASVICGNSAVDSMVLLNQETFVIIVLKKLNFTNINCRNT